MSEDEPDYMSEEFLSSCVKDVRPGLVFKASTKRKIEVEQKKKVLIERGRMKPQNVLEQERRAEGLKSAIPAGNKGFAMLCKMGYDPGRGLGKTGEGRLEPVGVEIKLDRGGLGREAVLAEIDKRKKEMRAARVSAAGASVSISEFRNRMRNQAAQKLVAADLGKSQRVCLRIDADRGIEEPPEKWFWPSEKKKEEDEEEAAGPKKAKIQDESESEDEEDEADDLEPAQKLELLTSYLRMSHTYCIWCGLKFEDQTDMASNCPGPTRDEH